MQLKNLALTPENFTNGGPMVLTDVKTGYEYKDGQRTDKVVGLKVTVVFPSNGYDTQTVTVADTVDRLSAALSKATPEHPVYVTFKGFNARVYVMNGRPGVSAKADSVQIVDDNTIVDID